MQNRLNGHGPPSFLERWLCSVMFARSEWSKKKPSQVIFLLMLCVFIGISVNTSAQQQGYFPPGPIEEGWPSDMVLIYSGFIPMGQGLSRLNGTEQDGVVRSDDGDWLAQDFLPYVAHLDASGEPHDTFFDTFLFVTGSSHRSRQFGGEFDQDTSALWYDWQWYIDRIFAEGKQLAALDRAVAGVGSELGIPDYKVNVYIKIPYPSYKVNDFGFPDGQMGGMSLLPFENRQLAVEWYVDLVVKRWEAWKPKHLRFAGFYWLQEHINTSIAGEDQLVRDAVKYVQDLGLMMGWIPWSGAVLATQWEPYGFDWAAIQPNRMFRDQPNDIQVAVNRATRWRMGIEIELDGRVKQRDGEEKLYEYLDGGIEHGYMNGALLGYYQDLNMLAQLYYNDNGARRYMYDDIYAFAKGTYPAGPDASWAVRGTVFDDAGKPVPGATVRAGLRTTETDQAGQFTVDGLYVPHTGVLITKPGYDPIYAHLKTALKTSNPVPHSFELAEETTTHILHSLDDRSQLGVLGLTLETVTDTVTEGSGALHVTLAAGPLNSLWHSVPAASQDWSAKAALAIDAKLVQGQETIIRITLLDRARKSFSRLFRLSGDQWHTLWIPLGDAAHGIGNELTVISGDDRSVDTTQITRVTISPDGEPETQIVLDNLRLMGVGMFE